MYLPCLHSKEYAMTEIVLIINMLHVYIARFIRVFVCAAYLCSEYGTCQVNIYPLNCHAVDIISYFLP